MRRIATIINVNHPYYFNQLNDYFKHRKIRLEQVSFRYCYHTLLLMRGDSVF